MKKLLLIVLLFVGCDNSTESEENNLIDLDFVIIKNYLINEPSIESISSPTTHHNCESSLDCAGVCNGDAVEQTYYFDNDGDGLGGIYNYDYCSADVPDNWVINSDDDDDTIPTCRIYYTFNLLEEDFQVTDGNILFTYNENDYSIDISSCIDVQYRKSSGILQDLELKIFYIFDNDGAGFIFSYSSPNELLYIN